MNRGLRVGAALWLVIILGASLAPEGLKSSLHTTGVLHNAFHFIAFFVASFLMSLASTNWNYRLMRGLIALTFAITTEYLESAIYMNTMEWHDVRTDAIGVATGLLAAYFARSLMPQLAAIPTQTSRNR